MQAKRELFYPVPPILSSSGSDSNVRNDTRGHCFSTGYFRRSPVFFMGMLCPFSRPRHWVCRSMGKGTHSSRVITNPGKHKGNSSYFTALDCHLVAGPIRRRHLLRHLEPEVFNFVQSILQHRMKIGVYRKPENDMKSFKLSSKIERLILFKSNMCFLIECPDTFNWDILVESVLSCYTELYRVRFPELTLPDLKYSCGCI